MAQLGLIDPGYGSLGGMAPEPDPVVRIPAMIGGGSMDVEAPPWFGTPESDEMRHALFTGVGGMGIPGLSDASALYADLDLMYRKPEERTWSNAGLTALGLLPFVPGMTVWHGSPHLFDNFDISKIGTGEGAQVYGKGLYFAENPDVAKAYHNALAERKLKFAETGDDISPSTLIDMTAPDDVKSRKQYYVEEVLQSPGTIRREIDDITAMVGRAKQAGLDTSGAEATREWLQSLPEFKAARGGALYEVDLPDEHIDRMLDWDAPVNERISSRELHNIVSSDALRTAQVKDLADTLSPGMQDELRYVLDPKVDPRSDAFYESMLQLEKVVGPEIFSTVYQQRDWADDVLGGLVTGKDLARTLYDAAGPDEAARIMHQDWGLPGIKYLDQGSRTGGDDATRNFVVFDDELVSILERHTD